MDNNHLNNTLKMLLRQAKKEAHYDNIMVGDIMDIL